ncbi:ankyrin repeat-containing domain protein [Mycena metata]|uniref:Ankyrin repeat-containing domain protein n=1 Tax=Mycena metata TaxID=1033252 RepID=A0AAD7HC47_9AGAR|nr:ankyrin repeat-containing domain protein [Mycena metata]
MLPDITERLSFDPSALSRFGRAVFFGDINTIQEAFDNDTAPNMNTVELTFQYGYASIVILGAQRVSKANDWVEVMQLLIENGLFVDAADLLGYTALHHATFGAASLQINHLVRLLTSHGANINTQNCFGEVSTLGAMQNKSLQILDVLLGRNADLDLADADGRSPRRVFVRCGPEVVSTTMKWIRRRACVELPYDEKRCDACRTPKSPLKCSRSSLKLCSRCKLVRYCSVRCQAESWAIHKQTCRPFTANNAVLRRPQFQPILVSAAVGLLGFDSLHTEPICFQPCLPNDIVLGPKTLVVKVQVPCGGDVAHRSTADLLVYSRCQRFACTIRRYDDPREYDRISDVVRAHGTEGVEAFFVAELQSEDCVAIRISQPLAEQPW